MFGIGWYFPVLLLWGIVGPLVWGGFAISSWSRSRKLAWFAAITSVAGILIPLGAAFESWVNAASAAMVFAAASLPVFLNVIICRLIYHLCREKNSKTEISKARVHGLGITRTLKLVASHGALMTTPSSSGRCAIKPRSGR